MAAFADYLDDAPGGQRLSGRKFERESFDLFELIPPAGTSIELENIVFDRCRTKAARGVILRGSRLRNVEFREFNCGRSLTIDADNVVLSGVRICGEKFPKLLEIKPSIAVEGQAGQFDHEGYCLDISDFHGEVDIIGVNIDGVTVDPARHAKLKLDRLAGVDLAGFGIGRGDFLRILIRRIESFKAREAILDLDIDAEGYRESVERLRAEGLVE